MPPTGQVYFSEDNLKGKCTSDWAPEFQNYFLALVITSPAYP